MRITKRFWYGSKEPSEHDVSVKNAVEDSLDEGSIEQRLSALSNAVAILFERSAAGQNVSKEDIEAVLKTDDWHSFKVEG